MQLVQMQKLWGEQPGPKAPQRVEAEYCKSPVVFRSTPQEWCKSPPSPNRWMTMLRLSRVRRGVRPLARPWVWPGQRTGSHARLNPCLAHPMQGGTKGRHPATSPCLSRRPPAKRAASTRSSALASHAQRRDRWPGLLRGKSRPGQGGYQVAESTQFSLVAETRGMHKAKQAAQHSIPQPSQVVVLILWQADMVVVEVAGVGFRMT